MAPPAYSAGRGVCSNIRGIASGTSTYVGPILSVLPPSMGGLSFFAPFFLLLPLLSRLSPFLPRVFSSPFRLATVIRVVRVVIGRRTPSPLPARSPRRCLRIVALVPPTATPARLTIPASTYIVPRPRRSFVRSLARSLDALSRARSRANPIPIPSQSHPSIHPSIHPRRGARRVVDRDRRVNRPPPRGVWENTKRPSVSYTILVKTRSK